MAGACADGVVSHFSITTDGELPPGFDKGSPFSAEVPFSERALRDGITDYAFSGCSGLTSISIPRGVRAIGDQAFRGCSGLTAIAIPESVSRIGNCAFADCSGLTSIVIPDGVTEIRQNLFYNCKNLTSVDIPDGVEEIALLAFSDCTGLTSINFPAGLTVLGWSSFSGCARLAAVHFPENLAVIQEHAFEGCSGLTSASFPTSVAVLGEAAFRDCSGLTAVVLPGATDLGAGTFHGCSSLVVVSLRSPLTMDVHRTAFDSCDRLTLVVATRGSGLVGSSLGGVTVVDDTEGNRRRALDLQYWRVQTHRLCSPARRRWVRAVLLVANRLLAYGPLTMPREMWYAILRAIQRCELGPAP